MLISDRFQTMSDSMLGLSGPFHPCKTPGQANEETAPNLATSLTAPRAEPTFPNCVDVADFRPVRTPAGSLLSDEKV